MSTISSQQVFDWIQTPERVEQVVRHLPAQHQSIQQRARQIANVLREVASPGDHAMMAYPANEEYVAALLGCFYAKVIAVPTCPVIPIRNAGELVRIAGSCLPRLLLCCKQTREYFDSKFLNAVSDATLIVTDEVALTLPDDLSPPATNETVLLAFKLNGFAEPLITPYSLEDLRSNEDLANKYFVRNELAS